MRSQNLKRRSLAGDRAEKIVRVDAMVAFGVPVAKACREVGLARVAYYRAKEKGRSPAKESAPSERSEEPLIIADASEGTDAAVSGKEDE